MPLEVETLQDGIGLLRHIFVSMGIYLERIKRERGQKPEGAQLYSMA